MSLFLRINEYINVPKINLKASLTLKKVKPFIWMYRGEREREEEVVQCMVVLMNPVVLINAPPARLS